MVSQRDFPDSWANDCDDKQTIVEVAVPAVTDTIAESLDTSVLEAGFNWVEIPVSQVETWSSKGDTASIKRTAKLRFPTEWDGQNVRDVVKGNGISGLTFGRISLKNDDGDPVLKHCGYIAGVGGSSNPLESKAWFYDMAELMKAVPVNTSFIDPTITDVARYVTNTIIDDTPIPLTDVTIVGPQTEEELAVLFENANLLPDSDGTYYSLEDGTVSDTLLESTDGFELTEINTDSTLSPLLTESHPAVNFLRNSLGIGAKQFQPNRDTLLDVLNWLHSRAEVGWHFEPTEGGVQLLLDVLPSSRNFAQDEVVSALNAEDLVPEDVGDQDETYPIHGTITVEDNNALYEINPPNTALAIGAGDSSAINTAAESFVSGLTGNVPSNLIAEAQYPVVKVRADPLYQAAGDTELPIETVESDGQGIDEAKADAISALQEAITGASEGKIGCLGNPYIKPYDTIDAFETCGDYIDNQPRPVRYEVQSVKHTESIDSLYRTELNVTVHIPKDEFTFVEETLKQA